MSIAQSQKDSFDKNGKGRKKVREIGKEEKTKFFKQLIPFGPPTASL